MSKKKTQAAYGTFILSLSLHKRRRSGLLAVNTSRSMTTKQMLSLKGISKDVKGNLVTVNKNGWRI
jgi:hypothetical protein